MCFAQFPPPDHLTSLVRCYWTVDRPGGDNGPSTFNTMADGLPGVMVVLPGGARLQDAEKGEMPPAFLYGQATRFRTFKAVGPLRAVGAYLQPHVLRALFGMAAEERTDGCFDLEKTYTAPGASRALLEAANAEGAIAAFNGHFTRLMAQNARLLDEPVTRAMELIMVRKGDVDVADLRTAAGLSARTFERRFKQSIGLPPLLFARIRRFQHTLALLREGRYTKLSDIAYAADYADQSHYIRSFKEFTGISPLEFIREGREVVENFVELPPS